MPAMLALGYDAVTSNVPVYLRNIVGNFWFHFTFGVENADRKRMITAVHPTDSQRQP
jgi:hypothetical protein